MAMNGDDFDNTNSEKMLSTIDTRLWHVQLESVSACGTVGNNVKKLSHGKLHAKAIKDQHSMVSVIFTDVKSTS